jgi:small subunit ribosomal protein S18
MNEATETPEEAAESLPDGQAGPPAEEKPKSAPKRRTSAAAEGKATRRPPVAADEAGTEPEATIEDEPAPAVAESPPVAREEAAPLEEGGRPAAPPGPAGAGRPEKRRHGRYPPRRKVCAFCVDHVAHIDYKDVAKLRRYLSDRGKIEPRRKTGTCAKHQRRLTMALKRARHIALLPYTAEHIRLTGAFAPRS